MSAEQEVDVRQQTEQSEEQDDGDPPSAHWDICGRTSYDKDPRGNAAQRVTDRGGHQNRTKRTWA